jgi:hypothetical protein
MIIKQWMSKHFFNLLVFLIVANSCLGQDTIFMRTDQRILCKVLEISPTVVKYKRWELIDGPLYIESKPLIARIKYANGFVENFSETQTLITKGTDKPDSYTAQQKYPDLIAIAGEPTLFLYEGRLTGENYMHALLLSLNNPKITEEIRNAKRSKKLGYMGFLAIPFGVAGLVCAANAAGILGFSPYSRDTKNAYAGSSALLFGATAFSIGATVHFDIKSCKANEKAIRLYREIYLSQ